MTQESFWRRDGAGTALAGKQGGICGLLCGLVLDRLDDRHLARLAVVSIRLPIAPAVWPCANQRRSELTVAAPIPEHVLARTGAADNRARNGTARPVWKDNPVQRSEPWVARCETNKPGEYRP